MKTPLLLAFWLLLAMRGAAQTIYGLGTITGSSLGGPVNSQGLIIISPTNGSSLILYPTKLTGTSPGQLLVGIDFRPINNLLYALGYDGMTAASNTQLYTLDRNANTVTPVGAPIRLELGDASSRIGFDFDPVNDVIRVTSTAGTNYQLSPATGALAATGGALAYAGGSPAAAKVSAVAYSNSYAGSTATTLYALDYRSDLLTVQSPPDGGILTTPLAAKLVIPTGSSAGTYGLGGPDAMGLDITYNPVTKTNIAYLTEVTALRPNGTRASNIYRLDLATGVATLLGNTVPASTQLNFEIRDLAVTLPDVPLPVQLVSFTAEAAAPAAVRLAWTTASEQNSAYFAVERSPDGALFSSIGQVAAAGSSVAAHRYGLTDAALPAGAALLYYRLRLVDLDGSFSYSPVRTVAPIDKVAGPGLFPNPAKAATTLVGASAGANVQVLDALGRLVATATTDATGRAELKLPIGLPGGIYMVRTGKQSLRLLVR